jgi:hypothetical protein
MLVRVAQANGEEARLRDAAQAQLKEGNRLFRDGDFGDALRAYQDAQQKFLSPKLFFNLARCEDKLHERASAVGYYARFLKEVPNAESEIRVMAEARIRVLAREVVAVQFTSAPAGTTIAVDGRSMESVPLDGVVWVDPGRHQLSGTGPTGVPWTLEINGNPGDRLAISVAGLAVVGTADKRVDLSLSKAVFFESKQISPSLPVIASARPIYRRWWFWAGVSAVLIASGVVAFMALRPECPADRCVAPWGP